MICLLLVRCPTSRGINICTTRGLSDRMRSMSPGFWDMCVSIFYGHCNSHIIILICWLMSIFRGQLVLCYIAPRFILSFDYAVRYCGDQQEFFVWCILWQVGEVIYCHLLTLDKPEPQFFYLLYTKTMHWNSYSFQLEESRYPKSLNQAYDLSMFCFFSGVLAYQILIEDNLFKLCLSDTTISDSRETAYRSLFLCQYSAGPVTLEILSEPSPSKFARLCTYQTTQPSERPWKAEPTMGITQPSWILDILSLR